MGNICDIFSFNNESNMNIKNKKNNNTNHVPFLDISNIYYDEDIEPPSYSQLRNIKKDEYNGYVGYSD
jgi:hypothetical protein